MKKRKLNPNYHSYTAKLEIESNQILHPVMITEALQEYFERRGRFCQPKIKILEEYIECE